ncbi:MAG: pyruvate dehydrogenase (acetyl-transferring), homodimeric type, partial [Spirochaetaceae bacterium]|nr:pyruvate dehydrogenase (acetyl-transferring), homodimeric type [Spirochaetaceae bacterium]
PARAARAEPLSAPPAELFAEFLHGTDGREASSTMAFVRILNNVLSDKEVGPLIVPIVPDEARTFGMEPLFRQVGIYSSVGQLYEPVDRENLLYYKEAKDGQVLEEGITEAGSFSSFIAAGNAYATHGVNTIPFFIYYSMFGFQRIGDLIWAAADLRCKGFFLGGTSGRTTLNGEGLQHQDGHSHVAALAVPTLRSYDPTYAYELAVIIEDGIRRMYVDQEEGFYYLTVMNENYPMPPIPEPVEETRDGILRGLYRFSAGDPDPTLPKAHLLGSGAILNEALQAAELLAELGVSTDVWSVTSYQQLYRDIAETERHNLLHPGPEPRRPYVARAFAGERGVFVAATDYLRVLPALITDHLPGPVARLGTDGFGRSDTRAGLRDHFEVSARYIALAALQRLFVEGAIEERALQRGIRRLDVDPDKNNPLSA